MMKDLIKFNFLIAVTLLLSMHLIAGGLYAETPWLHTDGNKIKDPSGNVVVLRGIDLIDLGFLDDWQGGAIAMIDRLTNKSDTQGSSPGWYPKVIRINITPPDSVSGWPHPFDPGNDDFYNNLLRPVVDYCRTKDMYVIIDWHYIANTYEHVATTSAFWTYMAPRFANDSHVLFELFNEPINNTFGSDNANWQSVRTDMQTWINIVRTYAPNNLILVGGASWSQIIGPAATYPLTGNNIVMVSHIYPGHWLSSPAGNNWYTNQINTCLTVYPVFMTEWGFTTTTDSLLNGTITNYGAPLRDFRESRKISSSAWVASYDWAPPMFNTNWTLRVGEGEMGGFTKDMLYTYRNNDLPGGGNLAPSISITSPANGAMFTSPANIVINATASDSDGTISQVRFYQGTTMLGTDTSSPYSFTWSNVGAGSYSLTADAIDNAGAITTSIPVDITVSGGGSGNIEVRARGTVGDETIDIRVNGTTVATHTLSTNYASYFGNGTGTVQVHFTNDNGTRDVQIDYVVIDGITYQSENMPINTGVWTTTCGGSYSEWLNCNGYIEYGVTNSPPTVSITSPANGATFTAPATITINATASDTDGTISSVAFYQGTTLLGTDTTSPYSYTWSSVAAGSYSLTAKATDNGGAVTTSSAVSITVNTATNNPPTVSITSPANGATFTAPATITINANASDTDGTISSVAFYQGSTLLGTDTTSPYSYTWSSVAAGSYSLTARATDNGGAVTTSSAINVTVNAAATAPNYQAAGSAVSGTGAISPAWPTHQSGDVALLIVESANQAISLSTPAGFVEVTNSPQGTGTAGGTAATRLAVYWKRATSSAESRPTVADSGNHQIARIVTFRGVTASGNPWDVTAGNVAATASASVSIPGATTTVANTLVVTIVANATDTSSARTSGWTNSNLTGLTERIDNNTNSGNGGGFGVATGVKATAGAYGTTTATLATSSVQARMSIALK
jgi:hypothetical protein